ncbi:MAG: hemerythrin domain-containing protein [Pseudomonadota bacterium]
MQRTSQRTSQKTTGRTSQRTTRNKKPAAEDAIMLLTADHKRVQKIFKDFEKIKSKGDNETKAEMIRTVCQELTLHAQLEEELFYPALREAMKDKDLVDEAQVEHNSAKQLIGELESMQPGDELYEAKFTVLGEYINHHIKEEQKEIFPRAKKAKINLMELGEEIRHRKADLQGESTMEQDVSEDEDQSDQFRGSEAH